MRSACLSAERPIAERSAWPPLDALHLDDTEIARLEPHDDAVSSVSEGLDPSVRDVAPPGPQRPLRGEDEDLGAIDVERPCEEETGAGLRARIGDALIVREDGQPDVGERREEARHHQHPAGEGARDRDRRVERRDGERGPSKPPDAPDADARAPVDQRLAQGASRIARSGLRAARCAALFVAVKARNATARGHRTSDRHVVNGAVVGLAVGLTSALSALGCAAEVKPGPARAMHPMIGEPAPAVHQGGIDGGMVDLPAAGARVTLVDFFASWCEPCARSLPQIDAFVTEHEADGLRLVLVSLDESPETAGAFLDKIGVHRPATVDPQLAIAKRFKVQKLPMTFVVDDKNQIVWSGKEVGGAHDMALSLLGKPVPVPVAGQSPRPESRPLRLDPPGIR